MKSNMKNKYIVHHMNINLKKWDLFIIFLAVYNSIQLPLELAFRPSYLDASWYGFVNHMIDFCFFIDIVLTFNTTFIHPMTGDEVITHKAIAHNYISGQFLIDLVSTVPLEEFITIFNSNIDGKDAETFVLFSCLKLIRILRLSRLINMSNSSFDFKLQLRLAKILFYIILYLHLTACLWFLTCTINLIQVAKEGCRYDEIPEGIWTPSQYEAYQIYHFVEIDFYCQSVTIQYIFTFYNAILVLTGNDIGPKSIYLLVMNIIILITGALFNANIFGTISSIYSSINRKQVLL